MPKFTQNVSQDELLGWSPAVTPQTTKGQPGSPWHHTVFSLSSFHAPLFNTHRRLYLINIYSTNKHLQGLSERDQYLVIRGRCKLHYFEIWPQQHLEGACYILSQHILHQWYARTFWEGDGGEGVSYCMFFEFPDGTSIEVMTPERGLKYVFWLKRGHCSMFEHQWGRHFNLWFSS